MLSPYDERTEETRSRIFGNKNSYIPNKKYRASEYEFWYYINTKGYFHILLPHKIKYNDKFSHFEIVDYLLTKDNTLKETKSYGVYKTLVEVKAALRA